MKMITRVHRGSFQRAAALFVMGLLLGACGRTETASAASPTKQAPAPAPGPASSLIGTWRQLCQPYLPGDGSSDITYSIDQTASDRLTMEGVAKDYKNTTCSGSGTVIATPKFEQRIVGTTTIDGVQVVKLVDVDATDPAPPDSKSVLGIDNGQLRIGSASGARDAEGFPGTLEPSADAYVNVSAKP
jgi:hypothetical protein